jgi:type VI secretion system protein ImpE
MPAPIELKGRALAETLAELQQRIRKEPGEAGLRTFLFQLLAVMGQWDRALTQLGVAGELDPAAIPMVHTYRDAVQAEALRAEVFAGRRTPVVFGEPADWTAQLLQAVQLSGQGHHAQAAELRARAFEAAPASAGHAVTRTMTGTGDAPPAGEAFEWIADADPRLGPMLEVVMMGRYLWVPFDRIARIQLEPVEDLRDLVWRPVNLTWSNGGQQLALLPVRYPGSESHADDALRLSQRTEWTEVAADTVHGLGQRMLATDGGEYPLLELTRIELTAGAGAG